MARTTTTTALENRIALTNLHSYNCGNLRFAWVSLPFSDEEFTEALEKIGNPEEYFVSDYETTVPMLRIAEYPDYEELNDFFKHLEELNEYDREALEALYEELGDYKEAVSVFERGDYQYYSGMDLEDVAKEMVDDGCFGEIPDAIKFYIDYDAIGRDLSIDGYHETSKGVVKVH